MPDVLTESAIFPDSIPMKVAIIILIWNGKSDTLECLQSLSADTYAEKEIVVVDNGSTDKSAEAIRAAFPQVTILSNDRNLGFCAGNNVGIRYALEHGFDFIFLLNNDTTVEPNAVAELLAAAQAHPKLGVAAPVTHHEQGERAVWFAGSRLDLRRGLAVHDNSRDPSRADPPYRVPWITGCAMFVRAKAMKAAGGLDERYFLSWEDVDFSVRVAALGWELGVAPAARIYHKGGQASTRLLGNSRDYYDLRNRLLFLKTHGGAGYYRFAPGIAARMMFRALRDPAGQRGDRRRNLARITAAIRDHLLGRYGEARRQAAASALPAAALEPTRAF